MISNIHSLVEYGLLKGLIEHDDCAYVVNQLSYKLNINPTTFIHQNIENKSIVELLEPLLSYAQSQGIIDDGIEASDNFESYLMDTLTMRPSSLQKHFDKLSHKEATQYFYKLCQDNHYIKTERINKNIHYTYLSKYGEISITINLSKPEKDPKTIAKLKELKSTSYPACLLCKENVGFYGHIGHPGRSNHRIIHMTLNNEPFYFQYSPYVYYNEHAIVFHRDHIPMAISKKTFLRLFDFVKKFPHYFLGSNAGLPIVGGSILDHEHYQGGSAQFPIESAGVFKTYTHQGIKIELLNWPLSVIRLSTKNLNKLIDLADDLRSFYEVYSDESVDLICKTTENHNANTPIARYQKGKYILDIALRNNRTNSQYPDGIFHPHPDVHAIKKENIGLIEVMGLAILPGRLLEDLKKIEDAISTKTSLPEDLLPYKSWIQSIDLNPSFTIKEHIDNAVGKTFVKGLEDCGVFKQTEEGRKRFIAFVEAFING